MSAPMKQIRQLANDLLNAAENENGEKYTRLYHELQNLCFENEDQEGKNHPFQWETLADFTENTDEAVLYYNRALGYADDIGAKDHMASICYSKALVLADHERNDEALSAIEEASEYATAIDDNTLKTDINDLLKALQQ